MAKTKTPKLTISHGFSRTKVPDLLTTAQTVLTDMTAAVSVFTAPPVPLATLQTDIAALTASSAASTDGSKKSIAQRNKDRHALEQDLSLLGAYVVKVANGDPAVVTTSGFTPAPPRAKSAPKPLAQPSISSIAQGVSGQLLISVTPVTGAHSYDVRFAPLANGVPGTWTIQTVTQAKKPVTFNGLTPGTTYSFQVRALGKAGYTDWSDSSNRMSI